jgi:cytochrome b involved in lipid metabolism
MENEDDDGGGTAATPAAPAPSGGVSGGITAAAIAQHNSRASCWSSINGNVYDLTSWIPRHPGGEQAILQLCGTDGSAKFNAQHGGGKRQATILAGFKIGTLTQ